MENPRIFLRLSGEPCPFVVLCWLTPNYCYKLFQNYTGIRVASHLAPHKSQSRRLAGSALFCETSSSIVHTWRNCCWSVVVFQIPALEWFFRFFFFWQLCTFAQMRGHLCTNICTFYLLRWLEKHALRFWVLKWSYSDSAVVSLNTILIDYFRVTLGLHSFATSDCATRWDRMGASNDFQRLFCESALPRKSP